nr:unnamed protein product [Callosobruchus chinensis]
MTSSLLILEKLDLEGESGSLGQRWKKRRGSLNIYLEAMHIRTLIKKRATLLLPGGAGKQEIFYNLLGANVEPIEDNDVFAIAIQKLDEYFSPKQSKVYERHVFRLIKQKEGEKFEKFVVRLRNQAEKCPGGGPLKSTKKKILTIGDNITSDRIIAETNTLEVVNRQLEQYGQPKKNLEVNSISQNKRDEKAIEPYGNKFKYNTHKGGYSRCVNSKDNAEDTNCPARKKKCYLCDKLGHFRQYCKSHGARKRRWGYKEDETRPNKRAKKQSGVDSIEDEEVDYVFSINNDGSIMCEVGGIRTAMLIDSGSIYSLITDRTWDILKAKGIKCLDQVKNSNKTLLAHGNC